MSFYTYFLKRSIIYIAVFVLSASIVWALVRFAPGDPALTSFLRVMMAPGVRYTPEQIEAMKQQAIELLGLNLPLHEQYIMFWRNLLRGDLGYSTYFTAPVGDKLREYVFFDLILLTPAIIVSWFIGNYIGALAARYRSLDRVIVPIIYILTATPYFLFGLIMAYTLGVAAREIVGEFFKPVITSTDIKNFLYNPSITTFYEFIRAYSLPFISLVCVSMGGWASGMRTLMVYELESNYARYMESMGFSGKRIAAYAFRYAINPQITGLGIQLGTVIVGGLAFSAVFNYPGTGIALIYAINFRDVFLIQGIAIVYTLLVIAFNSVIDILYILIDPRLRHEMLGR
ncbi:MAG: ABC transporter permease [Desulfurococcaceae archaeon]